MGQVIRRALAHVAPEELLLIPVVIIVALAILAQPSSITRLFETPFATPIPGDSPADIILGGRTPTPAPSPVTAPLGEADLVYTRQEEPIGARPFTPRSLDCLSGSALRESPVQYPDGGVDTLRTCVGPDGSIVLWDTTTTRLRVIPAPGSIGRP